MTKSDAFVQTANNIEKLLTMVLWKLQKDKAVFLTEQDLKNFMAAHEVESGKQPQLIVQGTEDGLHIRVLSQERAAKLVEEYEAVNRGIVLGE